eukprot:1107828-Pelagomonas_calceolata.AAC.6
MCVDNGRHSGLKSFIASSTVQYSADKLENARPDSTKGLQTPKPGTSCRLHNLRPKRCSPSSLLAGKLENPRPDLTRGIDNTTGLFCLHTADAGARGQ